MSDPVLISIIAAVQGVAIVLINKLFGDQRANDLKDQVQAVDAKVDETHKTINGRMEQLIVASKAVGAQDQRNDDRNDAREFRELK